MTGNDIVVAIREIEASVEEQATAFGARRHADQALVRRLPVELRESFEAALRAPTDRECAGFVEATEARYPGLAAALVRLTLHVGNASVSSRRVREIAEEVEAIGDRRLAQLWHEAIAHWSVNCRFIQDDPCPAGPRAFRIGPARGA